MPEAEMLDEPAQPWPTAVVGPGGVGGLVGGVLARAGHPVAFVARPETAATLNSRGLRIRSARFGDFHVPVRAGSVLAGPVEMCLLAVKATHLDTALDGIPAAVVGDGLILPLLNGVEHMDRLRARFPDAQMVAGAIRVESTRTAAGHIEHTSPFSWIEIASDTTPADRLEALAAQLTRAGLEVSIQDSEAQVLWGKLAFLAPFALLSTHAGAPTGVIRTQRRADLEAVIGEVAAVATASGARVDPARIVGMFDQAPEGMKSSMQRDVEAHRPTELDAIGGAVRRAAQRHNIPTPVTDQLVADLQNRQPSLVDRTITS